MNKKQKKWLLPIISSLIPVMLAFIVGSFLIMLSGYKPLEAYSALFSGALSGKIAIMNTLFATTPLILTGLATAIAFKANIYNMGVEGQLYLGAFTAAFLGFTLQGTPPVIHVFICLIGGALSGMLFALIPAILKAFFNVNEMVVTLMLNYAAILFTTYLASFPFKAPGASNATTIDILPSAELPRFFQGSQLNGGFIVAIGVFIMVWFLINKMKLGYEMNSIGRNIEFSEYVGMNIAKKIIVIMSISGIVAGLAGAGEILGTHRRFVSEFSPDYGWTGLTIALLGKHNPVGVLAGALLFGILKNGGSSMELMVGVPRSLIDVIQGLIILFLAVDFLIHHFSLVTKLKERFNRKKVA
ncbi:ABC transporter permease [Peribacillus loiseleuriae]|uniref:ABC transporter permease n=1 Tax=Peribacillus loiseleuriae TaxID=1679170 RepID=UPI000AF92467|nr:ABC transporter permease [Peribacillus loiseleuriae]